jgi:pSer/pThr/pTyr-binding forkhead associated (FHA) protein
MIKCAYCHYSNMEGALVCDECGLGLWGNPRDELPTRELGNQTNALNVKSGWGTATFQSRNQIIIHIRDAAEPLTLTPEGDFLIGRRDSMSGIEPDLDLTPFGAQELGVSRIHAAFRRGDEVLSIVDLDSANGTFLNGQRLAPNQSRLLRDGDEIRLGKLVLHVYFK